MEIGKWNVFSLELLIKFTTKYDVTFHHVYRSIYCEIALLTK